MALHPIDGIIIGLYLVSMVVIRLVLRRRAAKSLESYFLGGRTQPWYLLGLSNVLTGAEWIRKRFGDGAGGRLSHMVVVCFAVIGVVGSLSYGFTLFGLFFMMMLFKGVFAAMAGPAPNYDMQKILSTRTPAEACKMSGFVSVVLLFPRYLMITGFAVLAIVFFREDFQQMGGAIDFEKVWPLAIKEFVPVGLMGLLLAGLFAAFMGTFASTVNAAPAYLINDVYLRYINPRASGKKLIYGSYLISGLVVALSTLVGFFVADINSVLQWIVSALYGGYIAANVLKWHWWRFNGHGYFWGMASGIVASMVFPVLFPGAPPLYYFPLTLAVSVAGCIVGTYATPPTEGAVLMEFYRTTRPWGWCGSCA